MEDYKEKLALKTLNKMCDNPDKLLNGLITIGFDVSEDDSHCCLVVAKFTKKSLIIIKEYFDEEAYELFKKIIGK